MADVGRQDSEMGTYFVTPLRDPEAGISTCWDRCQKSRV